MALLGATMTFIRSVQEGRATLEETLQLGIAKVLG